MDFRENILVDLREKLPQHHFLETTKIESPQFIYEVNTCDSQGHSIKQTIMQPLFLEEKRGFEIKNDTQQPISHICIDGDFISYGQEKYDAKSEKQKDGRPDCIIFDNQYLLFIELKLDQEDESFDKEKSKWNRFFKGVNQIEDFVGYLRNNNIEINQTQKAIVCMRFEPKFQSNAARNREKLKRSEQLGFEILASNNFTFGYHKKSIQNL